MEYSLLPRPVNGNGDGGDTESVNKTVLPYSSTRERVLSRCHVAINVSRVRMEIVTHPIMTLIFKCCCKIKMLSPPQKQFNE